MTDPAYLGAKDLTSAVLSTRTAQPEDIDELGHVNNAVYVRWVQDAAVAHWFAVAPQDIHDAHIWVCSRHEIDYLGEIKEGETVEVRTWLGEVAGARFSRHVDIRKPGAKRPSAKAVTWWVLLDRATGRPRRVGPEMLELFGLDPKEHRAAKES
ncbi:MAG: thioesterase family protein [Parvularcula sp.]|jgi:acyl-CoA thioester hydrolase|nr:thioesterase family protein [Parvularcula sp.]